MSEDVLYTLVPAREPAARWHGWMAHPSFGDPEGELDDAAAGRACVDHSMFGRIEVSGADRIDLLHRLSTNALTHIEPGGAIPTVFVTDKGRIIDRVLVCATGPTLLLLTSPGAEAFLVEWIGKYTITEDIRFRIVTDATVMVSLIGPETVSSFCARTGSALPGQGSVVQAGRFTIARESDGELAHVIAPKEDAPALTAAIAALAPGARWIGFRAWEAYRIGRGIPARPGELSVDHNPLECGLRGAVSFTKGCYIGQEVIARLDTYGKERHVLALLSFRRPPGMPPPAPLAHGESPSGTLTSLSDVPRKGAFDALAVVLTSSAPPGASLRAGMSREEATVRGYFGH